MNSVGVEGTKVAADSFEVCGGFLWGIIGLASVLMLRMKSWEA